LTQSFTSNLQQENVMTTEVADGASKWHELLEAAEFAACRFAEWEKRKLIPAEQALVIAAEYGQFRQEWPAAAEKDLPLPTDVVLPSGAALGEGAARTYRLWQFVGGEVNRHAAARRLNLAQKHACLNEVKERLAAIRRRLADSAGIVMAELVPPGVLQPAVGSEFKLTPSPTSATGGRPRPIRGPRKPLLEMLLDPRSMPAGGCTSRFSDDCTRGWRSPLHRLSAN